MIDQFWWFLFCIVEPHYKACMYHSTWSKFHQRCFHCGNQIQKGPTKRSWLQKRAWIVLVIGAWHDDLTRLCLFCLTSISFSLWQILQAQCIDAGDHITWTLRGADLLRLRKARRKVSLTQKMKQQLGQHMCSNYERLVPHPGNTWRCYLPERISTNRTNFVCNASKVSTITKLISLSVKNFHSHKKLLFTASDQ